MFHFKCMKQLSIFKKNDVMDVFFFLMSQNCRFYIYILIVCNAKLFAGSEGFSSRFNCAMIQSFGVVIPVF